jgi:hypothetical protein
MFPNGYFAKTYFDGDYFAPVAVIIVTEKKVHVRRGGGPDFVQDIEQIMREDDEVIAIIIAGIQADLI